MDSYRRSWRDHGTDGRGSYLDRKHPASLDRNIDGDGTRGFASENDADGVGGSKEGRAGENKREYRGRIRPELY